MDPRIDYSKITFNPIPPPPKFDVQKRIADLQHALKPNHELSARPEQHKNILAVIKLYQDGKLDGSQHAYVIDGQLVTEEQFYRRKTWGVQEVRAPFFALTPSVLHSTHGIQRTYYQYVQKCSYGRGPMQPGFHAVRPMIFFVRVIAQSRFTLQIRMLIRLIPDLGGDETSVTGIIAMNDTGSNVLTLYDSDLTRMGNLNQYNGWENIVNVDTASRSAAFRSLLVEVQLLDEHD